MSEDERCNYCDGTGEEYQGDLPVGPCQACGGSGFNEDYSEDTIGEI